MGKLPVIGISGSILIDDGGMFPGYERAYVNNDYCSSVLRNGGVPFIIPVNNDRKVIEAQIDQIDALILSGGHDVFPQNYGEEPRQKIGDTFPERDQFDFALIEFALKKRIPILGVCRGFQVINVYFGGILYQDLSYISNGEEIVKHFQEHHPTLRTHTAIIDKDSRLYEILGEEKLLVNSFHHQCVKEAGEGLRIVAHAMDEMPEAVEKDDYPFLLGVQWHPEMLSKNSEQMASIFKTLIHEAGNKN